MTSGSNLVLQGLVVLKLQESQGLLLQEGDVESVRFRSRWSKFVVDDFDQLAGSC